VQGIDAGELRDPRWKTADSGRCSGLRLVRGVEEEEVEVGEPSGLLGGANRRRQPRG
jgi:hypothetical protein